MSNRRRHQRYKVSAMRLVETIMDLPSVERQIIAKLASIYNRTQGDVFNLYIHMDKNVSNTKSILSLTNINK